MRMGFTFTLGAVQRLAIEKNRRTKVRANQKSKKDQGNKIGKGVILKKLGLDLSFIAADGSRTVYISDDKQYRILEVVDHDSTLSDLKGDCFDSHFNPDVDVKKLRQEELEFESLCSEEGVFGYILEKWNPSAGVGWEHIDSIFGFVGRYRKGDPEFEHYIVHEYVHNILTKKGA